MNWIKAHLTVVIVSAVSILAVTGMVLGIVMSDVADRLQQDLSVVNNLRNPTRANGAVIEEARQQQEIQARQIETYLGVARQAQSGHKPLHEPAFLGQGDAIRDIAANAFKDKYKKAQRELLDRLKAKDAPSGDDYTVYINMKQRERQKTEREGKVGLSTGGATWGDGLRVFPGAPHGSAAQPGAGGELSQQDRDREELKVLWGKDIYCYANLESLDPRPEITESATFPSREQMWYAQMALWVEQDVIGALSALNEKVAQSLPEEDRWVAHLPVKNFVRFRLGNYVPPSMVMEGGRGGGRMSSSAAGGDSADLLKADAVSAFTGRGSDETTDVLRFYLELVVEAREMLRVIDAVSQSRGYIPLHVAYQVESVGPDSDYAYGWEPVVRLSLVYEASFMRSDYESWLPETVAQAIRNGQAEAMSKEPGISGSRSIFGASSAILAPAPRSTRETARSSRGTREVAVDENRTRR